MEGVVAKRGNDGKGHHHHAGEGPLAASICVRGVAGGTGYSL